MLRLRAELIQEGYGAPVGDEKSWDKPAGRKPTIVAENNEEHGDVEHDDDDDGSDESDNSDSDEGDDDDDADEPNINGIRRSVKRGGQTDWKTVGVHRCGDTGHSQPHPVEDPIATVRKNQRTVLLSDAKGLSATNHLIDSMLADIMEIHVKLVERLKVRAQPVPHMAARWITGCHRTLKFRFLNNQETYCIGPFANSTTIPSLAIS
eukprot:m.411554 g.411554  ORF g.411554 m.411554 type:complete len:207 (-) comp16816_c0_seq32:117-737(-)